MSESQHPKITTTFEGRMYLFEKPELLTREQHASLGISPVERPFEFVRKVRAIPIVVSEVSSAQKHFPIVFSDPDDPSLLAIMGFEEKNLFVADDGSWEPETYVPAYIRCHPFALASGGDDTDRVAVVIDRASRAITENPARPFFDGDKLSAATQARVELSARFASHQKQTREYCRHIKELGLVSTQQVMHKPADGEQKPVATFVSIDIEKLKALADEELLKLHREGMLSAVYGQLFSNENWNYLISRRERARGRH